MPGTLWFWCVAPGCTAGCINPAISRVVHHIWIYLHLDETCLDSCPSLLCLCKASSNPTMAAPSTPTRHCSYVLGMSPETISQFRAEGAGLLRLKESAGRLLLEPSAPRRFARSSRNYLRTFVKFAHESVAAPRNRSVRVGNVNACRRMRQRSTKNKNNCLWMHENSHRCWVMARNSWFEGSWAVARGSPTDAGRPSRRFANYLVPPKCKAVER